MRLRPTRNKESWLPDNQCHFDAILERVIGDPFWEPYLRSVSDGQNPQSIHLAVFVEPFLGFVLNGRKTVESRFSAVRCPPFDRVRSGDVILLKKAGGPVVGLCRVSHVWSYNLDPDSWREIRQEFTEALCAQDPLFWESRAQASYATLMKISEVKPIPAVAWKKRDRRGWVVLQPPTSSLFEAS